jgi:excisionase family DNA binding protein
MATDDITRPMSKDEQDMARIAQRCIVESIDRSRAAEIMLTSNDGAPASVAVPPKALRLIAQLLGALSEGKAVTIMPSSRELSTLEAAHLLNVSRPFLVKEMEAKRLPFRRVGSHRRIALDDLKAYRMKMQVGQTDALQRMADNAAELGLDY